MDGLPPEQRRLNAEAASLLRLPEADVRRASILRSSTPEIAELLRVDRFALGAVGSRDEFQVVRFEPHDGRFYVDLIGSRQVEDLICPC